MSRGWVVPGNNTKCPVPPLEPETEEHHAAKMAYIMRFGLQAPFTGNTVGMYRGIAFTTVVIPTYSSC